jgi:hypothetical protein
MASPFSSNSISCILVVLYKNTGAIYVCAFKPPFYPDNIFKSRFFIVLQELFTKSPPLFFACFVSDRHFRILDLVQKMTNTSQLDQIIEASSAAS